MVSAHTKKKSDFRKAPRKMHSKKSITKETTKRAIEKKVFDQGIAALATTGGNTWSAITLMNSIRLGTAFNNHIGRKVNMTSIAVRVRQTVTATPGLGDFRTLVVYDKSPQTALPAITDILNSDSSISMPNMLNSDRFVTLIDHITHSNGFTSAAGNAGFFSENMYRKIGLGAEFKADTGAITDFSKGAIYCAISSAAGNAGVTTHDVFARIRYTDI